MRPASPARRLRRQASVIPFALVAALFGCSDAPSPVEPRPFPERPFALVGPTIVVTNLDDSGPGSLRQAIIDAADGTTIQFDAAIAGKTIVLSTGELVIDGLITIEAPVPAGMTISGGLTSRVFRVAGGGSAVLRNLSIVNGRDKFAGGIHIENGTVVLDHSLVAFNEAAEVGGGGIYLANGNLTLVNSTLTGNSAAATGGGILAADGSVTIRNSTIAFNTAEDGGGIFVASATIGLRNSIIADNVGIGASTAGVPNCVIKSAAVFSGKNISNDDSCGPASATMIVGNPSLLPLADNGGPTKTHAIGYGAAVDAGQQCSETTDQRYVARNQGSSCDLGAFEFDTYETFTLTLNPNGAVNKAGVATVSGTIRCSRSTSLVVGVQVSQTQKTKGKFTTIVNGQGLISVPSCTETPSSWSVVITQVSGQLEAGQVAAIARPTGFSGQFLMTEVAGQVKLFQVK